MATLFEGTKYHIDLAFLRDEFMGHTFPRIFCDGKLVTTTWFSPDIHPLGAHTVVEAPPDYGDDLCPPDDSTFPWDVAHLSRHLWNRHRLIEAIDKGRMIFSETEDSILVGTSPIASNRSRILLECPRRCGFNIARAQFSVVGESHSRMEFDLQWRPDPSGLWYVKSFQEVFDLRSPANQVEKRMPRSPLVLEVRNRTRRWTPACSPRNRSRCPTAAGSSRYGRER